jgi:hypothetical protein
MWTAIALERWRFAVDAMALDAGALRGRGMGIWLERASIDSRACSASAMGILARYGDCS